MNMSNYKMIYKDKVFNVIEVTPFFDSYKEGKNFVKPQRLDVIYLDENNELKMVSDEAWMFQFVRKNERE